MPRLLDITGQRYDRLVALRRVDSLFTPTGKKQSRWEFRCDCGVVKEIGLNPVRFRLTKSCGCLMQEQFARARKSFHERDIREEALSNAYSRCKTNAAKYGRGCLTRAQWQQLVFQPCFYCGGIDARVHDKNPSRTPGVVSKRNCEITMNGVDRLASNIGYKISNCVSCCWQCNRMKGALPVEDFLARCRKITAHNA